MSRILERCVAVTLSALLSTCLLPDAVWQAESATEENLGAAGAAAQRPGEGMAAGPPPQIVQQPGPLPRMEGAGGGRQVPLAPPASGAAGGMAVAASIDAGAACSDCSACGPCAAGVPCAESSECASTVCGAAGCADGVPLCCQLPSCADGALNGTETSTDCGGSDPACVRCAVGLECNGGADCASGSCLAGRCADCSNDLHDGLETGIDCGGNCPLCGPGQSCVADADCVSGACQDGTCCGGVQGDCTRCARRLVSNLDCGSNGPTAQPTCDAFLECLRDNPAVCEARLATSCTAPGAVCDAALFGGDTSQGIALADAILGTAQCNF